MAWGHPQPRQLSEREVVVTPRGDLDGDGPEVTWMGTVLGWLPARRGLGETQQEGGKERKRWQSLE